MSRHPQPTSVAGDSHTFDVIRSPDLVAFTVRTSGLELAKGQLTVAGKGPGLLAFELAFQHLGEEATYESAAPVPNEANPGGPPVTSTGTTGAEPAQPVDGVPARRSRVVVQIPAGETVEVSTSGFLEALGRYRLEVHPLAGPGTAVAPIRVDAAITETLASAGLLAKAASTVQLETTTQLAAVARAVAQVRADLARPELATVAEIVAELVLPDLKWRRPRTSQVSRPPTETETAIEAPYRLAISPTTNGGWTHSTEPVVDESGTAVELWHTRLGSRTDAGVREGPEQIRAIWARDRERADFADWATIEPHHDQMPMRMSLDGKDRHMIVRQSTETWFVAGKKIADPQPVTAHRLFLSSLGAWLDLHADWETTNWSAANLASILSWDHLAPMGRDQYVRVAYPGYLFPFGHRAALVKVTERKIKSKSKPRAALYQSKFLIVGEPVRSYTARDLPFTRVEIAPTITPALSNDPNPDAYFVPEVGDATYQFVLHCRDADGNPVKLATPLVWVPEKHNPNDAAPLAATFEAAAGETPGMGQSVSFVPSQPGGADTAMPTTSFVFTGTPGHGSSIPHLLRATAAIPAVDRMSRKGPQTFSYAQPWLDAGFSGANPGEVWAQLAAPTTLGFGTGNAPSSDSGGFVAPSLPIEGLSRVAGPVGDLARTAGGGFDPQAFFGNALPKLFGFVKLTDILDAAGVDLGDAPALITESLAKVEALIADLLAIRKAIEDAAAQAQQGLQPAEATATALVAEGRAAIAAELKAKAQLVVDAAGKLAAVTTAAEQSVQTILALGDDAPAALAKAFGDLIAALTGAEEAATALPPLLRDRITELVARLRPLISAADTVTEIIDYLAGIGTAVAEQRFSLKWQPKLKSLPVLELPERGLTLAVDGQGGKAPKVAVRAELRGFALILPPDETMMRLPFDHLSFSAGSGAKTEVDAVVGNVEFLGILGFVERIKQLIPLDGFSDPPYCDVSPSGVVAGFSLGLPDLAIGVFTLSNMSLSADVRVPFLGEVVSVGFAFCSRERPFNLAVMCLGGGGWFAIRLSPRGLEVLELGLEAGAYLAVNFGVASGSISIALGIYLRMEAEKAALTAYLRMRGEVSVLGLISASIELYLAMKYDFPSGKMIGRATITVKVKVLCLSKSVEISCERRLAGSNGDPTFAEVMAVQPDHTSELWNDYCLAFASE